MCWTTSGSPFEVIIISLRLASTSSQALLSFLKRQSSSCPLATWAKLLILFESSFIFMTTGLAHPARPQLMSTIGIINLVNFMLFLLCLALRIGMAPRSVSFYSLEFDNVRVQELELLFFHLLYRCLENILGYGRKHCINLGGNWHQILRNSNAIKL